MTSTNDYISVGHAEVQADSGTSLLSGLAIFGFRPNGVLVTEAGVPASAPIASGRIYMDVNGPVNTGIAFANPTNSDVMVNFRFTDTTGADFKEGDFRLNANTQIAAFLNQAPFSGAASMRGMFSFDSSLPVGVIALRGFTNERGEFLVTTLPVSSGSGSTTSMQVLPQFADGGGWTTQIILTNPFDFPTTQMVQFFGPGNLGDTAPALNISVNGVSGLTTYYLLLPRSTMRLVTGNTSPAVQVGSVHITPMGGNPAADAMTIFSFKSNGVTSSEAGVAALPTGLAFRMYAEVSGISSEIGSIDSGLAVANPSTDPISVALQLVSMDGSSPVPSVTVTVPPNGQLARFIRELFPALPLSFRGFLKATANTPINVTGLRGRYNERGDFLITTTPPRNDALRVSSTQLIFPHIVSGGGYTTQFMLYGQSASGQIFFNSQNGSPLSMSGLQSNP